MCARKQPSVRKSFLEGFKAAMLLRETNPCGRKGKDEKIKKSER